METFRCPTCIGVLPDARANRCPNCGQNIRRRPPKVLGEDTRIGATNLPIDRWMLDRLHNDGRGRHALPPVAWHGKFTTSPLAEPDFSATPVPTATPLAPPSTVAVPDPAPTVGALALDAYTLPISPTDDVDGLERVEPEPVVEPVVEPAPVARPVTPPEELDPDVRALVDDLYKQAREELSGTDLAFFTPMGEPVVEPPPVEAPASRPEAPPRSQAAPPARSGWQPALVNDQRKRRHLSD